MVEGKYVVMKVSKTRAFDAEYETGSNGGAEVELTAGVGDISVLTQQ